MDIDQARRIIQYHTLGETNVVVQEAHAFVLDYETRQEQRMERWMGWDE